MAEAGPPGVVLEWDTGFFGFRVGKVLAQRLSDNDARRVLAWAEEEQLRCLYFLADATDPGTSVTALEHGFDPVDIRMTLTRQLGHETDTPALADSEVVIRGWQEADLAALRALAATSHRDSRFFFDRRFSRADGERLFRRWIESSCRGWADEVLVAEWRDEPVGYQTLHLQPEEGRIGLIAVAKAARGRGLGTLLIQETLRRLTDRGLPTCSVVTQARNVAAQRLYQSRGFLTSAVAVWHHRWFDPPDESR